MNLRALIAFALSLAALPAVLALESLDRRSRSEPEITVRDGGRSGACDAVRFNADGAQLFAGGDDKVVTVWEHTADGLVTDADKVKVLRWPAWREQRGSIKDLAVSADGKRVFVGGYGLRPASVAILDRDPPAGGGLPKMALTWPKTRPGKDSFRTVEAVALSADGTRAAFATRDGSVWLWIPKKLDKEDEVGRWYNPPLWVGRHTTEASRRLLFREKDQQLVSVDRVGEVVAFDLTDTSKLTDTRDVAAAPKQTLFTFGEKVRVFYAVFDPARDTLAVAVDRAPQVLVRGLAKDADTARIALPKEHVARTLAFSPADGSLAIAAGTFVPTKGEHQFHNDGDDTIRVYRKPTDAAAAVTMPVKGQAESLAFHPTLDRLAVAGGDADEVTLYDLARPKEPLSTARGAGRKPWALALSADGRVLGMQVQRDATADRPNGRGTGDWTWLDLSRLIPLENAPKKWQSAVDKADGWEVTPDARERDVWYAVNVASGAKVRLNHDTLLYNKPTCYTFLAAANGRPTRLLVGHSVGASYYEMPKDAKATAISAGRTYVGHGGEVLAIAAVDDDKGGWFVTGGSDHQLAAYSLAAWASHPTFGTAVEMAEGALRFTKVDVGSPAWEAGLQPGDELVLLAVGLTRVYDRRPAGDAKLDPNSEAEPLDTATRRAGDAEIANPDEALALLGSPRSGLNLYLRVRGKNDVERDLNTSVRQRPLWKLYPSFDDAHHLAEWVVWMWKGSYYHTGSTNGDRLVGWYTNATTSKDPPRFHPLADFKQYQKKDLLRKLIEDRNLAESLEKAIGKNPLPPKFGDLVPAPIRLAVDRTEVTEQPVKVTVQVERQTGDVDLLPDRVELWVNDHRLKTWTADPTRKFEQTFDIAPKFLRSADNRVTVKTYNRAGGSDDAARDVVNRNAADDPTLLGLAVGVDKYQAQSATTGIRGLEGALKYAVADARAVSATFANYVGPKRYFPAGGIGVKSDTAVVRKKLIDDLEALKTSAKPDDVLVLFLAGHGVLLGEPKAGGKTVAIPDDEADADETYTNVRLVFCCPDFKAENPADAIISADELYERLAGLNCRKVVMLDVCHAGWAARTDVIRQLVPNGQGPFVMAACRPGQKSNENDELKHGLFTSAVLEATTRSPADNAAFHLADADKNGRLSCAELFAYVEKRVIEERKGQNPTCFPQRSMLPKTTVVAVARTNPK